MAYTDYSGIQVTLTTNTTVYKLLTLLQAVDADTPPIAKELNIQNDAANVGDNLFIGDASLAKATRYGIKIAAGNSRLYQHDSSVVPLADIYLQGSADSMLVNVEVIF